MRSMIYNSIEYTPLICTSSKLEANGLLRTFFCKVISKLGALCTMKLDWMYTLTCFQELSPMHVYDE